MAILPILHYPDPRLRNRAQPVERVDDEVRRLVDDMFETMYQAPGIGLAAPQLGVAKSIIVIDISEQRNAPHVFINPRLVELEGVTQFEEGCLSVPGIYEEVERASRIRVEAINSQGENFTLEAEGLLAVCIQHEIDHLDGKLFVDYLSELKRQRIRKKMEKLRRHTL